MTRDEALARCRTMTPHYRVIKNCEHGCRFAIIEEWPDGAQTPPDLFRVCGDHREQLEQDARTLNGANA